MSITTSSAFINFTNGTPRAEKIIATSNVGIGTSAPAYNLDVSGDINFTGTLYENGVAFSGGGGGGSGIDTTQTLALSNVTTGLTVSSNAIVTGNVTAESFIGNTLTLNTVAVTSTLGLDEVLNNGNTSSNTIQITNSTESVSNTTGAIVVSGGVGVGSNLFVGKDLTVSGTVTLNAVSLSTTTNFQEVTNDGNTTTNTVEFRNDTLGFMTTSNVEVGGELTVAGSAYFENIFMSGYITHTLLNEAEFIWDPSSYLSYSGTGSTVYDINGNMNGTINNTDYYGESWRMTASNSRIQTASTIDLRRDWTILLWHRPPGTDTSTVRVVGHGTQAVNSGLHIISASTTLMRYGMYANDMDFGYSTGHVNRDRWRQYAFTYYHNGGVAGGVNKQVYQDERLVCDGQAGIGDGTNFSGNNSNPGGTFADLGYQPYQASPTVLRFGTSYGSGDGSAANNWFGPILFFGRVLSASEIRSLYRFYSMRFSHD